MSCHQVLKEKGYRLTPQRVMVLDALHRVDKHISAEEIHAQVVAKYPNVNISTVYSFGNSPPYLFLFSAIKKVSILVTPSILETELFKKSNSAS